MIAIGRKPRLYLAKSYNDMSHFYPSEWSVAGYFCYVTDEMYWSLLEFTDPELMNPPIPHGSSAQTILSELNASGHTARMKRAMNLNPEGSQLWQFNALATINGQRNYVRYVAAFGSGDLYVPSKFDIYVKLPLYQLIAKVLNKTLVFRRRKEYAEWERFYEE